MFIKNPELSEQPVSKSEMPDLANQLIRSLKNHDRELLRGLVTKDFIRRLPGNTPGSGVAIGVDSFRIPESDQYW